MNPGDVIDGKYRVEAQLGEGGMAVVLAATHLQLDSTVAIKLLKRDALVYPEVSRRFLREARAAGRLRNEHLVRVSDVGQLPDGMPYMVMEMLHGEDVSSQLRDGPLPSGRAVEYAIQACEGLAEAHALGMIHRDVKPANLFVTRRPNGAPMVKLLDFGIATAGHGEIDHKLTTTRAVIGSPSYMSPEQLRDASDVDARSDIWSLGVTLYEMLAGRQPFEAPTLTSLSLLIVTEPHPPLDGIAPELYAIIDRCLAKQRDERFADVGELATALAPFADGGELAASMVRGVLHPPGDHVRASRSAPAPAVPSLDTAAGDLSVTTGFGAGEPRRRARRRRNTRLALALALITALVAVVVWRVRSNEPGAAVSSPRPAADRAEVAPPPAAALPVAQPPAVGASAPEPGPAVAPVAPPQTAAPPPAATRNTPVKRTARGAGTTRAASGAKPIDAPAKRSGEPATRSDEPAARSGEPARATGQPCSPSDPACGL